MRNPGWVDLQVNGHLGVDFSDPELTADAFLRAAESLLESGTEVFLPTLCTAPLSLFRRNSDLIRRAVESHGLTRWIPGLHFEGPFISGSPGAVGAHQPQWTLRPDPETVAALCDAGGGFLRILTMAAELPGAVEGIAAARSRGVVVSLGHQLAGFPEVAAGAAAGAALLTHLGNGVPNQIDRHFNPIWAGLAEPRLKAMIITDGHHLPGELVRVIIRCKGVENVIITSDASRITGLPPGAYSVMGNASVLDPDGRLYCPERRCLVGSASTLSRCMAFLAGLGILDEDGLRRVGRDNPLAVLAAAQGSSGSPGGSAGKAGGEDAP